MEPNLHRRIQRYGWDKAAPYYEKSWRNQLQSAHDLVMQAADVKTGENILDIAAGTGLIAFRLAEKAGPSGSILATDISEKMVELGNNRSASLGVQQIRFERMGGEKLDAAEGVFDLTTCALGLMYFPDPQASLDEMFRVLKPGGRAVAAVWGSRKKCGWAEIFPIVDARVDTDVCPMFFNLGEGEMLKRHFEKAGFKNIAFHKIETKLIYTTDQEVCEASFLGGPVALAYPRFDEETKRTANAEYIASLAPFKTNNGYEIPGEFVVCSGVKPFN